MRTERVGFQSVEFCRLPLTSLQDEIVGEDDDGEDLMENMQEFVDCAEP